LLRQNPPFDVLFTDVVMPGRLTGLELVAWTREHCPEMPAVVATGYSAQQPDAGVAVLRKPYTIDQLLTALRGAVQDGARLTA
jgi:CheY-like chemotaxis protein